MTDALDRGIREYQAGALPPTQLEQRIVERLVREGLLARRPRTSLRRLTWPLVAAAAVIAIVTALWLERPTESDGSGEGLHFALVLDTVTQNYGEMDPDQAALLAQRYTAWIDRIRASGRLVDALYLKQPESKLAVDQVSGIVVVRVHSLEEAQEIVADSPHTARGGRISIREIATGENLP